MMKTIAQEVHFKNHRIVRFNECGNEEEDLRNVYCYDNNGNLKWIIEKREHQFGLSASMPWVLLRFQDGELRVQNQDGIDAAISVEDGSLSKFTLMK